MMARLRAGLGSLLLIDITVLYALGIGPAAVGGEPRGGSFFGSGLQTSPRNPGEKKKMEALTIRSSAFQSGDPIPQKYTAFGEGISPPLEWSEPPAGTKSLVLILDDPDAPSAQPFVHWVLYDIPANVRTLDAGIAAQERLAKPAGALHGMNSRKTIGYFGPMPPQNDPPHHYHFRLYALDTQLNLKPGATREAVDKALTGHVLAAGGLVGTVQRK
jgi:Raf kinase inhibitor-like YbhB/YbcL family protein